MRSDWSPGKKQKKSHKETREELWNLIKYNNNKYKMWLLCKRLKNNNEIQLTKK